MSWRIALKANPLRKSKRTKRIENDDLRYLPIYPDAPLFNSPMLQYRYNHIAFSHIMRHHYFLINPLVSCHVIPFFFFIFFFSFFFFLFFFSCSIKFSFWFSFQLFGPGPGGMDKRGNQKFSLLMLC